MERSVVRGLHKFEYRNPKFETNTNNRNQKYKTIRLRRKNVSICKRSEIVCERITKNNKQHRGW